MNQPANDYTWILVVLSLLWIVAQYGLATWALRDLWRRPRVRGNNKMLWALTILLLPIAGPILYSSFGPTSFLPRPPRLRRTGDEPPPPPAGDRP